MRKNIDFSKRVRGKHANMKTKIVGAAKNDQESFDDVQNPIELDLTEENAVEIVKRARNNQRLKIGREDIEIEKLEKLRKLAEQTANKTNEFKPKYSIRPGRPPISREIILEAEIDAYTRPLSDVALKYGISVKTLNNYGITRQALNKKIAQDDSADL